MTVFELINAYLKVDHYSVLSVFFFTSITKDPSYSSVFGITVFTLSSFALINSYYD